MSKAESIEAVYDELVVIVEGLLTAVGVTVDIRRGYPRVNAQNLVAPSAYIFFSAVRPEPGRSSFGSARDRMTLSVTAFLQNELQLFSYIGKLLDSPLNGRTILNGIYTVDYEEGYRISSQDLPVAADYGFTFRITVPV